LKQVGARIIPPPADTDYPGAGHAEGKVPVIESKKLFARSPESQ
jgi:hypothetical protein